MKTTTGPGDLPQATGGPGLFAVTEPDGHRWVTNLTRKVTGNRPAAGGRLVSSAALLLAALDLGLFAVSLVAQDHYIFTAKQQWWPAWVEAFALDAGMVVFSLLALGLARAGQAAPVERLLIVICALGSAGMNYAAADVSSPRSVAAYVMPPAFLAIVTDRVIAVVRRHVLGMDAERSAWAGLGRALLVILAGAGKAVLYGLRLILAPRSTCSGARTLVLISTPLPGAPALAQVLDPVRAALSEDLTEVRDRYELTAAQLDENLRVTREALRTEASAVREALRTETASVHEALRTEASAVREAAHAQVATEIHAALGDDLREVREHLELTAAQLDENLRVTREALRTEITAVREALRTETASVHEALRTASEGQPPVVDRDALVAELADRFRAAIGSGEKWAPDYDELHARTGYQRRWCQKAVADARAQVFAELNPPAQLTEGDQ